MPFDTLNSHGGGNYLAGFGSGTPLNDVMAKQFPNNTFLFQLDYLSRVALAITVLTYSIPSQTLSVTRTYLRSCSSGTAPLLVALPPSPSITGTDTTVIRAGAVQSCLCASYNLLWGCQRILGLCDKLQRTSQLSPKATRCSLCRRIDKRLQASRP
ncbi:hypothetical protein EI94DRAFT_1171227 [Lactarius quietus]|nr:hypothetical protein EI94DRAFT_1171227 [Lactarius quietus]